MERLIKIKFLSLIAIKPLDIAIFNVVSFCISIKTLKCKVFYVNAKEISCIIYKKKYLKESTPKKIKEELIKYILFK